MSACKTVRTWWTTEVLRPVEEVLTEFRNVCKEIQKSIEESVEKPVEEFISEQQKRCEKQPWWNPLRWLCALVTVVVKVVTWITVTVVKWITVVVCEVVSVVVGVVVRLVLVVVSWAVSFLVCLFSEPLVALASFRDLWTGILDILEDVFDLVGTLLENVVGILDDLGSLIETIGNMLGPIGVFLAGIVKWVIGVARTIVEVVAGLIDDVQDILFGILRLNWCRIANGLSGVVIAVARVILLVPRIFVGFLGGIRDAFEEGQVETIVERRLEEAFPREPEAVARASKKLRLGHRPFGMPVTLDARRFFISSRSPTIDLRDLHDRGVLDLNAAVGLWSRCQNRRLFDWARWEVVYAGTDRKVAWADVQDFLDGGPDAAPEFRVYAISRDAMLRDLRLAERKAHQIGLALNWKISDYEVTRADEIPVPDTDPGNDAIMERVGRVGAPGGGATTTDDLCRPPAIAIFSYENPSRNGLTSWFRPKTKDVHPSGVTFRDRRPEWVFRWTLIHELGHYFGLSHDGHNGAENIMFTNDPTAGLTAVTPATVAEYALFTGESRFTFDDARTAWEWIVENAKSCLT